ncbi:MAG: hypothetical protein ABR553_06600 [Gammaproteobacteria bacterium]
MINGLTGGSRALAVATCLGLAGVPAHAGEFSLLLNGKAIHLDVPAGGDYNEKNWGLGVQYDMPSAEHNWVPFVTASGFKDSESNTSYYLGGGYLYRYGFHWGRAPMHLDVGAVGFLMKRKHFKGGDLFPGILPALSLGTPWLSINMTYVPKVDPKMVPLLFFQIKVTPGNFR